MPHETSDVAARLWARRCVAGAQQQRPRSAGVRIVNVDRQEAVCPVVAIPEAEMLQLRTTSQVLSMSRVICLGSPRPHQLRQFAGGRRVLPSAHCRLAGKARARQLDQRQAEAVIIAQRRVHRRVRRAAEDRQHPCPRNVIQRMHHSGRIAPISVLGSKPFANPVSRSACASNRNSNSNATSQVSRPPSNAADTFSTHYRKTEGRHAIVNGGGSSLWHFAPRCRGYIKQHLLQWNNILRYFHYPFRHSPMHNPG
jgi:hypothetical protein